MAKLNYTAAEIDALLGKVATNGDDVESIIAAFPFALQRGEYTLNDQSELTFDTLVDTKYYRYTASAIGNPVSGGYGIIINVRFTAYAVQILFSQTTATAPTQMLYRMGTNMSTTPTWKEWQTVSTGSGGGGATITQLWSNSNGAQLNVVNTLSDNINNFDVIYLKCGCPADISNVNKYSSISFMPAMYSSGERVSGEFYGQRYLEALFENNTFELKVQAASAEGDSYRPTIYSVVGIKY